MCPALWEEHSEDQPWEPSETGPVLSLLLAAPDLNIPHNETEIISTITP